MLEEGEIEKLERKAISGIMVTLIAFTGLVSAFTRPVMAESIPTTEILYDWDSCYSFPTPGIYIIATETNPIEMLKNYTKWGTFYPMLKEHVITEAGTNDFISILISRGMCPTSGYGLKIESIEKTDYTFVLNAIFTDPDFGFVAQVLTNPTALIPIGNLLAGKYSITLHIQCDYIWGTETWTAPFEVLFPAPDLTIEGVLWPWMTPVLYVDYNPAPSFYFKINVTVANLGTADAGRFNVSFTVNFEGGEIIPKYGRKWTVEGLPQGANTTFSFDFFPEDYGRFTLTIAADCDNDIVELDETNNVKTTTVRGSIRGDFDGDGYVGPIDLSIFAAMYGKRFVLYHPADLDHDGYIGPLDLGTFAACYGKRL